MWSKECDLFHEMPTKTENEENMGEWKTDRTKSNVVPKMIEGIRRSTEMNIKKSTLTETCFFGFSTSAWAFYLSFC